MVTEYGAVQFTVLTESESDRTLTEQNQDEAELLLSTIFICLVLSLLWTFGHKRLRSLRRLCLLLLNTKRNGGHEPQQPISIQLAKSGSDDWLMRTL